MILKTTYEIYGNTQIQEFIITMELGTKFRAKLLQSKYRYQFTRARTMKAWKNLDSLNTETSVKLFLVLDTLFNTLV